MCIVRGGVFWLGFFLGGGRFQLYRCFVFCVCVRVLLFLLYNKIYVCAYLEMYNLAEVVIQLIICVYSDVLFLFVFQLYRHFVICIFGVYLLVGFFWWGFSIILFFTTTCLLLILFDL